MNSRRKVVTFSLGATVSNKDGKIDSGAIKAISDQFKRLAKKKVGIVAVVGAGGLGREYISFAKKNLQVDSDMIGIEASRANALLLSSVLQKNGLKANSIIPESKKEVQEYIQKGYDTVVLGGIEPAMTSDSTAADIAKDTGSNLVIVSTVGGIMENADVVQSVNASYLRKIISKPRQHVLDPQTCKILLRNRKMKALVTGYENIYSASISLASRKQAKNATEIILSGN
ncbi:MAG: amino acid kinase family protein [Nitrososphaerales archaeon]